MLDWFHEKSWAVAVTVFGCFLAVLLFGAELKQHLVPQLEQTVCMLCLFLTVIHDCLDKHLSETVQMSVDTSRERLIRFTFDVTFPSLPCQGLYFLPQSGKGCCCLSKYMMGPHNALLLQC